MNKVNRQQQILHIIEEIENSPLSVKRYFEEKEVPFGYTQYYNYKKILKEKGIEGLIDNRTKGNHLKITGEISSYIMGLLDNKINLTSSEIREKIKKRFNVIISISAINSFRKENNLSWIRPKKDSPSNESGASEIVVALAIHSGLIGTFSDFIYHMVERKRGTKEFKDSELKLKDHVDQRSRGKFTSHYNKLSQVKEDRFKSIEEKINNKKFDSMDIFKLSAKSIERYCIALFSLPLVTSNGRCRSVNNVKGNALTYLCGYNYKAASLDKYIRELKYLQISNELIEVVAKFWLNFWRNKNNRDDIFACYYIDGNTKALWSSKSCCKGKVTMHGRIMNCIEQLFIHDGQGHPIYFKTFNGHADLGSNGLEMVEKITKYLNECTNIENQFTVNRILIMDGGGNAVKVLREISDYFYITILDTNQVNGRKVKFISDKKRYEYGAAYLIDCKIELEDSNEKGYILETRAVEVKWDNGRSSTLVTNLAENIFSPDNVVKSYFDRWPKQELDFKKMKSGVSIHRMVGYGKKLEENTKVIEKVELLQNQINKLEQELSIPLSEIRILEKDLQPLIEKERLYREKSIIKEGKRSFKSNKDEEIFKDIQKQLVKINNKIKRLKKGQISMFNSLKKKKDELSRIIDKKKRYHVDVELDQLMTCFKISFANICSYLLDKCFEGKKMSFQKLFESIFDLSGKVRLEDNQRKIDIDRNPKELEFMKKLEHGFEIVNDMNIKDLNGYTYSFQLV